MRIGLIDADLFWNELYGKKGERKPNMTLMKISAWHKEQGDDVEWYCGFNDRYDKVYIMKDMDETTMSKEVINANEVVLGGISFEVQAKNTVMLWPGWRTKDFKSMNMHMMNKLSVNIRRMEPDWDLYPGMKPKQETEQEESTEEEK